MSESNENELNDSILTPELNADNFALIKNTYQNLQIKEVLEIIGQENRFQYITLIYFCICTMFVATISFAMPFIYYLPKFYCNGQSPDEQYECPQEQACQNPFGYTLDDSVKSAVYIFDLVCENKIKMTRAQNIVFLIPGFGVYIFSILSDIMGRKPIFFFFFWASGFRRFTGAGPE